MLGELESRMAANEDYETAAQMRDIRKRLNG
jgi:protein-arginine kinase activator protein McsA